MLYDKPASAPYPSAGYHPPPSNYNGPPQPLYAPLPPMDTQPVSQYPQPYPSLNTWQGPSVAYSQYPVPQPIPAMNSALYHHQHQQQFAPQGVPPSFTSSQPISMGQNNVPAFTGGGSGWNAGPVPGNVAGSGLMCLSQLKEVKIFQKVELVEAILNFETNNKYELVTSDGQMFLKAKEDTDCCSRQCLGSLRAFEMTVEDPSGADVIHLSRPLACQGCCFPCCLQEMEVSSPPGNRIATIKQEWTFLASRFTVCDELNSKIFRIEGPLCTMSCFGSDVEFKIIAGEDIQIGSIKKEWGGFVREMVTDADQFGVTFPFDLDVKMKAALIGATFLIDFMFYEQTGKNR